MWKHLPTSSLLSSFVPVDSSQFSRSMSTGKVATWNIVRNIIWKLIGDLALQYETSLPHESGEVIDGESVGVRRVSQPFQPVVHFRLNSPQIVDWSHLLLIFRSKEINYNNSTAWRCHPCHLLKDWPRFGEVVNGQSGRDQTKAGVGEWKRGCVSMHELDVGETFLLGLCLCLSQHRSCCIKCNHFPGERVKTEHLNGVMEWK